MDYAAVIELVGYDIIFLGLLTLLACYVGWELWRAPHASKCLDAFKDGWNNYRGYLQGCLEKPEECATPGTATPRPSRAAQLIGMLLMASLLGMVINIIGDRMLDSDLIVRHIPFVLPELQENKNTKKEEIMWWPDVTWYPEDAIKYDALDAVSNLYNDAGKKVFLAKHEIAKDSDWRGEDYRKGEKHAKELFQRAYASTLSSDNKPIQSALRYEYLTIKVLRTLFATSIILLLIAACGPWRKSFIWWKLSASERLTQPTCENKTKGVATAVLLLALPLLFLALWSTQSKRYDKKVFHAYLMLAKDDDVLKATPAPTPTPSLTPSPTPTPSATPASTRTETNIPKKKRP